MARAIVLGGCGGVGKVAARALACGEWFEEIVIADLDASAAARYAETLADEFDRDGISGVGVDAGSPADVSSAVAASTVAVNCIGPFYRFGEPVLRAVIDARTDYIDVCDDLDATVAQLELDGVARDAGVCAVIGLGNSPGLANLLAKFAADEFLDQCESVDIMHIHGGEPSEGAAVVKHRIHAMTDDVPLFIDGDFVNVRLLEESGRRFVEETDFRDVGRFPVYPYPHPETITLPRHIPGLRRATNRGVVFPLSYFEYTMDTVRAGLAAAPESSLQPAGSSAGFDVPGPLSNTDLPIDDWVEDILAARPKLLEEAGVTVPKGCLKIKVTGLRGDERHSYVFSLSSTASGAGEGTGIPAALGAIMIAQGLLNSPGVHPPEAVVDPMTALSLGAEVVPHFGLGGEGGADLVKIEHVGPDGVVEEFDLPLL